MFEGCVCMPKMLTNEEFLQKLEDLNIEYIPLEEYQGTHTKIKWMCHKNQNHIFEAEPCDIYSGKHNCPYCKHRIVFVGETDMWTTRPDMAKMLKNPEDGYKYFATGGQKVDWICPCCNSVIKDKVINNVNMFGLSCPNCSDGISFGEKFVHELLTQLKVDFIYDRITAWSKNKRYDFYIPTMKMIIEIHGIQHYERSFVNCSDNARDARTLEEEKQNDCYKKTLALHNGIEHYIQLDCRISDFDHIKQSILNSELNILLDLSIIDWNKCFKSTFNSNVIICSDLWNSGMKSTKDIANYIGFNISSVILYLKRAAKIGLCNYELNYKKNKSRYKKVLCVETQKIYEYIGRVKEDGYNYAIISKCCRGLRETAYGMHWKFI